MIQLTDDQLDLLRELVNVGIGRAAYSLSEMVSCRVGLKVPEIAIGTTDDLVARWAARNETASLVTQAFDGDAMSGVAALVFPQESARGLVSLLVGAGDDGGIDAEREAVLMETANIIINGVMGSVGNLTHHDIEFGLPKYAEGMASTLFFQQGPTSTVILVEVVLAIQEHAIEGQLAVLLEVEGLEHVWQMLDPLDTASAAE